MSPVKRKFRRTARQLYARDRPGGSDFVSRTRVHHEERNLMPPGECLEFPAGFRHAVHFMVDARKKRDPWTTVHHQSASDETASVETTSAATTAVEISRGMLRNRRRSEHPLHGSLHDRLFQQPDAAQDFLHVGGRFLP